MKLIKEYVKRIIFATKVFSLSNKKKMKNLRDECSKYKRCFIIGTGSSLTKDDLQKLEGECLFVSNRFLYYGNEFHPTAYFCQDPTVLESTIDEVNSYNGARFKLINSYIIRLNKRLRVTDNTVLFNIIRSRYICHKPPLFSTNPLKVYDGFTVTYSMIQIAVALGFEEIYLLGIDFSYKINDDGRIDLNGSHAAGIKGKSTSGSCDMEYSLSSYRMAKEYCEKHHIKIYNATRGGKLEVFERIGLDQMFS